MFDNFVIAQVDEFKVICFIIQPAPAMRFPGQAAQIAQARSGFQEVFNVELQLRASKLHHSVHVPRFLLHAAAPSDKAEQIIPQNPVHRDGGPHNRRRLVGSP